MHCGTKVYASPFVMKECGGRVLFDKTEHCCVRGAFPFCFHRATPNEVGATAGLFAPSASLDEVKVLAPAPCAHWC